MSKKELCKLCGTDIGIYTCPKCNLKYCSSKCYKHPTHQNCSELFYQEWVTSTLHQQTASTEDKSKVLKILKKNYEESENTSLDSDDEEPPIEGRFADLNLDGDVDQTEIWKRMNESEKENFKHVLENSEELENIVPFQKPWWTIQKLSLVSECTPSNVDTACNSRPPLPIGIKSLSELTNIKPSDTIPYNIVNLLYAYVFIMKLHNCDIREFIEDTVDELLQICPVITFQKNYLSLEESIQDSIRLLCEKQTSLIYAKSLCQDVCAIINGPINTKPNCFVLSALNDVKTLFLDMKLLMKKTKFNSANDLKKQLNHAVKKLDYFLSWVMEHYSDLKTVSDEVQLKYYPEIATDSMKTVSVNDVDIPTCDSNSKNVLIEEMN